MRYHINQWGVVTEMTREMYWNLQSWQFCPPAHIGEKTVPVLFLTLSGIPEIDVDREEARW